MEFGVHKNELFRIYRINTQAYKKIWLPRIS